MKIAEVIGKQARDDQILHLRKQVEQLENVNQALRVRLGEQKEIAQAISDAIHAAEPAKPQKYQRAPRPGSPVAAVLKFSDWHTGAVIDPNATEGFGAYNWKIEQQHFWFIVEKFLAWIDTQRHGYRIDELHVFGEGDYISGDIHEDLRRTNEFPAPVQTANAGLLLGTALERFAKHFRKVRFIGVGADNHGRTTVKPIFKQKAQTNLSYLVHCIARTYVRRLDNIEFIEAEGMKYLATVAGRKFLIEHGDTVKTWMGIPYYGLERAQGREARRRMNTDRGFDYQSIAHWHVGGIVARNIIINSSLSGTDELDHAAGRHAPPGQVAFLVHPKHGIFNFVPFQALE